MHKGHHLSDTRLQALKCRPTFQLQANRLSHIPFCTLTCRLVTCAAADCQILRCCTCFFPCLQERGRFVLIVFFTLSLALLWFLKSSSWFSLAFTWLGLLPCQVRYVSHRACSGRVLTIASSASGVRGGLDKALSSSQRLGLSCCIVTRKERLQSVLHLVCK